MYKKAEHVRSVCTNICIFHTSTHKSIPFRISTTKWVNLCWLQMAKTYGFCSGKEYCSCAILLK